MSSTSADRAPGPMSAAYRVVTVALVLLTTMIAFEAMAVTTAMPRAAEELDAVGSYGLAFSTMMTAMLLGIVLAGIWGDRSGPIPPLYAGQLLFVLGTIGCAAAPTWVALLGGRLVTGLGAGLVVVSEFVAIGRVYPAAVRPQVFTWVSAAWVVPSVLGAPVAGWLTSVGSWRWVFWAVVGPAVLAFALIASRRAAVAGPADHPPAGRTETGRTETGRTEAAEHRRTARLGGLVALSAGLVQLAIHEQAALTPTVIGIGVVGLVGLAAATPRLLPPGSLTGRRGLPAVVASRALFNASFMSTVTYVPLLLVTRRDLGLTAAGGVVAAASIGWSLGSWWQGRPRHGATAERTRLVWTGALLLAGSIGVLTLVVALALPLALLVVTLVAAGLAMGFGSTTLSVLVLDLAPPAEHGRASAALQLSDVLGSVLGIGASTAVFGALHARGDTAYAAVFALLTVIGAAAVVTGLRTRPGTAVRAAVG